jgi:hypothetical protein
MQNAGEKSPAFLFHAAADDVAINLESSHCGAARSGTGMPLACIGEAVGATGATLDSSIKLEWRLE